MTHRKQGFYNIKVMVNIQSPIPTSLYTTELSCEKNAGGGFVYLPSLFFSSYLPCLHTFWCAIPTFFTFLMFLSCFCTYFVSYNVNSNVTLENIQGLTWLIRATGNV